MAEQIGKQDKLETIRITESRAVGIQIEEFGRKKWLQWVGQDNWENGGL